MQDKDTILHLKRIDPTLQWAIQPDTSHKYDLRILTKCQPTPRPTPKLNGADIHTNARMDVGIILTVQAFYTGRIHIHARTG